MNHPNEQIEHLKVPPQSIETEQAVLGGLMIDNAAWDRIADVMVAGDFYRYDHRIIFEHIVKLIATTRPADVMTVREALAASGKIEEVGGLAYLNALAQNTPSAANIRRYAEIVRDRAVLRRLIAASEETIAAAYDPQGKEVSKILDEAESRVFVISEEGARTTQGLMEFGPLLTQFVEQVDQLHHSPDKGGITGTPTGFIDIDKLTAGMHGGELIIIAGRPASGKSALAMNIGEYVAVEHGLPIAVFSQEMPALQLTGRVVSSASRIDQNVLKTGKLSDEDWVRLTYGVQKLAQAPIFIDESGSLTANEIRSRSRRLARQCGKLGLVIVDYVQLCATAERSANRATELGNIVNSLRLLAKELDCPVIALSQLNRELEKRPNKRPIVSDLAESGAIEQHANVIIGLYRDEVYNPDTTDRGTAEAIILKNRAGATGVARLTFHGNLTKFANFIGQQGAWTN